MHSALRTVAGTFLVLFQTSSAEQLSTAAELLWVSGHTQADQTEEVIRILFRKLMIIASQILNVRCHDVRLPTIVWQSTIQFHVINDHVMCIAYLAIGYPQIIDFSIFTLFGMINWTRWGWPCMGNTQGMSHATTLAVCQQCVVSDKSILEWLDSCKLLPFLFNSQNNGNTTTRSRFGQESHA